MAVGSIRPMEPHPSFSAAVVYSSMFGATERIAEVVADLLRARLGQDVPCLDAAWCELDALQDHDLLLIGACTWNIGQLPHGWESQLDDLAALDLRGTTVALFGTGDQLGYPDTFLDSLGMLAAAVRSAGARLVGSWPTEGYEFSASLALESGVFVGLALDDDNQPDATLPRVDAWLAQVMDEAGLCLRDEARASDALVVSASRAPMPG